MSGVNGENNTQLNVTNYEELYKWIDGHAMSRPKKNLNRDFSDAVAMAELLKAHYPRQVEMHNYAPRNSLAKKIDNWNTLNRKVLTKICLRMTAAEIEACAKGTPGAVEQLLEKIKKRVEPKYFPGEPQVHTPQEIPNMVSADLLDKLQLELDIKNESIEMLGEKVKHLQNLLQLKDQRIDELTHKLEECITQQQNSTSTSFFKIF